MGALGEGEERFRKKITTRPRAREWLILGKGPRTSDLGGNKVALGGLGSLLKGVQALVVEGRACPPLGGSSGNGQRRWPFGGSWRLLGVKEVRRFLLV